MRGWWRDLIRPRAKELDLGAGIHDAYASDPAFDPYFTIGNEHVEQRIHNIGVTYYRGGYLEPPVDITVPDPLPHSAPPQDVAVFYNHARFGTGPHDMDPLIPEGES